MTRIAVGLMMIPFLALSKTPVKAPEPLNLELSPVLDIMKQKIADLEISMNEDMLRYVRDVYPIEVKLLSRARNPDLARAAAWAIVLEAEERHLSPALVASVMKLENPWLVLDTTSFAGAVGWMQIMPMHLADARYNGCGPDLTDGRMNVCYGTTILREYIGKALDRALRDALLAYNGCVKTPGCEVYATHVMRTLE